MNVRIFFFLGLGMTICSLPAQTINVVDFSTCFLGPDVLSFSASDGGSPARNIYSGTANGGSFPFRVIWNGSRWELDADTDFNGSYETLAYSNTFASVPNPPALGTGTWTDHAGCGPLTQFDGTGTQTTLGALPVEFLPVEAIIQGGAVRLSWTTASELNNEKFEVQFSPDGTAFFPIGEVPGQGNSTEVSEYSFSHTTFQVGLNYYRIKQIDYDGQHTYSQLVSMRIEAPRKRLSVYPNPSPDGRIQLTYEATNQSEISLTLLDVTGRVLQTELRESMQTGYNQLVMQIPAAHRGMFLLKVQQQQEVHLEKVWVE